MISNIQRFSVHDGPGIRTTVFFKGCMLRCTWCSNPETHQMAAELMLSPSRCTLCGNCIAACPEKALSIKNKQVVVDQSKCTLCGKCTEACPYHLPQVHGMDLTAEEIMDIVLRDRTFYEASEVGGVTISGGEPMMQPELAGSILKLAKKSGITTCIETCLSYSFERLEAVLDNLDYIYFDFKHADSVKHKKFTRADNKLIKENIRKLMDIRPDARMRIPVIPGFNDSDEDIDMICEEVKNMGITKVELMKYHNWATSKYRALGRSYNFEDVQGYSEEAFGKIRERYQKNGIELISGNIGWNA